MFLSIINPGFVFKNFHTAVFGLLPGPQGRSENIDLGISSITVSNTICFDNED
jgi:hypothetical protein